VEPIVAEGLRRVFGAQVAVDGVSFAVPRGAVYGFLGPNGAGKSTTIRVLLGLVRPDEGRAAICGHDVVGARRLALAGVGSIVETPALYGHLTGRENLEITRRLLGCQRGEIGRVLGVGGLSGVGGKRVKRYSLGMKQRLGLARALLGEPSVLILDEPTNGLDPSGIREMRALIRSLPDRSGATVLVSSHHLSEVEQLATHVGVMDHGRLLFSGAIAELFDRHTPRVEIGASSPERVVAVLAERGLRVHLAGEERIVVDLPASRAPTEEAAELKRGLLDRGIGVHHLALPRPSLEDLFFSLTSAQGAGARAPARAMSPGRGGSGTDAGTDSHGVGTEAA